MMRELIIKALECLPEELQIDPFFGRIKGIVWGSVTNIKGALINNLNVGMDIYEELYSDEVLRDYIEVVESENSLLYFILADDNGLVSFRAKRSGEGFEVTVRVLDDVKTVEVNLEKKVDGSIVDTKEYILKDELYEDYNFDVYFYDKYYNLRKDIDVEHFKDVYFSEFFNVPLENARELRLNFKANKKYLNECLAEQVMKDSDMALDEEQLFSFRAPFCLENLQEFINTELDKESDYLDLELAGLVIGGAYEFEQENEVVSNNLSIDKLTRVYQNLVNQIGLDGKIVISENLFKNFVFYLMGFTAGVLNTNGIIIKRVGGSYTIYYVGIVNDMVMVNPHVLTEEERLDIFYMSDANQADEGLREFFGVERFR